MQRLPLTALAFLLAALGCGQAGGGTRTAERDSAGITIVENVAADSTAWTWWSLEGPRLDIGGETAEGAEVLFRVAGAVRLDDGILVVANGGSSELRFFDTTGAAVRSTGGAGDGPGEFRGLGAIFLAGDTLLAYDVQLRRMSVFTRDGRFVRDFQLRAGNSLAAPVGRLEDGRIVGRTTEFAAIEAGEVPEGVQRPTLHFITFDGVGQALDTVSTFPGDERVIHMRGNAIQVLTLPFGRRPTFAARGDALIAAAQDAPEVRIVDASGATRRIIRTGAAPVPLTPERLNARIEQLTGVAPEPLRAGMRETYRRHPAPDHLPPYGAMLVDAAGNIWLADTEDPLVAAPAWTVFDVRGVAMARAAFPARFRPFDIGDDYVLGVLRDELDVEHVQLYVLVKSS